MGGVINGTPVDAENTNPHFIETDGPSTGMAVITLAEPSTPQINDIQKEHNSIASFSGKATNTSDADLPSYLNDQGFLPNEDLRTRLDNVSGLFNNSSGHRHTGNPGDAPRISASDISGIFSPANTTNLVGSRGSPQIILAASGIGFTGSATENWWFVQGASGGSVVSANPQISLGITGQKLRLQACSDTDTITLSDGNGLKMNGLWIGSQDSVLWLACDGSFWVEDGRNGI